MTSEASDLAVRRTCERFAGCEDAWDIPVGDATFELRAATLRDAIDAIDGPVSHYDFTLYPFGTYQFSGPSDAELRGITILETLVADHWEETTENHCLRALAMQQLGWVRKLLGDFSGCMAAFLEADKHAISAGREMQAMRCDMLLRVANFLSQCGKTEESTAWARKAAELVFGLRPEVLEDRLYILEDLANILSNNGAMEESLRLARKAVAISERIHGTINDPSEFSSFPFALLQLAVVHCRRGELEAADAAVLRAKDMPGSSLLSVIECLDNLANICEKHGDMAAGISFRNKAVAFLRKLDEGQFLAISLGDLGVALTKDGQWREACAALDEALAIYSAISERKVFPFGKPAFRAYRTVHTALGKGKCDEARDCAINFEMLLDMARDEEILDEKKNSCACPPKLTWGLLPF